MVNRSKKDLLILIILLSIQTITVFSQKNNTKLKSIFTNADTVMLVSHTSTNGNIVDDTTEKRLVKENLIINGKPNRKIIVEESIITDRNLDTLIKILERPFFDKQIEQAACFDPHQAIFIINQAKTSYFEICFGCGKFSTSKDLSFIYAFDKRKWAELMQFYINRGFKYYLVKTETK